MTEIPIDSIAKKIGAKSSSKIIQMRKAIRNGNKLPSIRVALIDISLKEKLGRLGVCTERKKYFLLEGHHRHQAFQLERKHIIDAKIVRKLS